MNDALCSLKLVLYCCCRSITTLNTVILFFVLIGGTEQTTEEASVSLKMFQNMLILI